MSDNELVISMELDTDLLWEGEAEVEEDPVPLPEDQLQSLVHGGGGIVHSYPAGWDGGQLFASGSLSPSSNVCRGRGHTAAGRLPVVPGSQGGGEDYTPQVPGGL